MYVFICFVDLACILLVSKLLRVVCKVSGKLHPEKLFQFRWKKWKQKTFRILKQFDQLMTGDHKLLKQVAIASERWQQVLFQITCLCGNGQYDWSVKQEHLTHLDQISRHRHLWHQDIDISRTETKKVKNWFPLNISGPYTRNWTHNNQVTFAVRQTGIGIQIVKQGRLSDVRTEWPCVRCQMFQYRFSQR